MQTEIVCDKNDVVVVNGVPYYKEITKEKPEEKKLTGYEAPKENEPYWFKDTNYEVCCDANTLCTIDYERIVIGNAFLNKNFAEMIARHDKLWFMIRRWQALNDESINTNKQNYYIQYNDIQQIVVMDCYLDVIGTPAGVVLFTTQRKAQECIEEFWEDLEWDAKYYKPRMDARGDL